jgi:ribonucleoside-diphosphate reductase alpha chain
MHRAEAAKIDEELVPPELLSAAQEAWDIAVEAAETYGVRNSQATVLAPTGTIGLLMDCDTTGVEPDLGLVKTKKLVGGGTMSIINQTVPRALARLGYSDEEVDDVVAYVDEHKSILGAPHVLPEHLPVFACSMGDNTIHYRGHVRMMAAVQPFISGAISKTVNMSEEATVAEVEQLHIEAWKLGLKAIAIYRDNCKVGQPLATTKMAGATAAGPAEAHDAELAAKVAELEKALQRQTVVVKKPVHEHMPRKRKSLTFSFRVADCEGYATVGEFPDGRPGEVFVNVSKQGSTLAGIMDAFAISVSMGLQHGVPLATFVRHFTNMRFEPAGMTDDPDLRFASSLVDYIFRRLAVEYMSPEERADLGIFTVSERLQPTLPGVEEAVTVDQPLGTGGVVRTEAAGPAGPAKRERSSGKPAATDAPYCYQCGVKMQRAGSCFACPSCGTTSGCS